MPSFTQLTMLLQFLQRSTQQRGILLTNQIREAIEGWSIRLTTEIDFKPILCQMRSHGPRLLNKSPLFIWSVTTAFDQIIYLIRDYSTCYTVFYTKLIGLAVDSYEQLFAEVQREQISDKIILLKLTLTTSWFIWPKKPTVCQ